ncbi:hypothetical protein PWT90_05086 [Aphanocladium album]|nr:hypothetical protein PWT90_05086 [Aphanocladium album]
MDENPRKGGQGRNNHQKYSAGRHKAKHGTTEWAKKRTRSIQRAMSRNADIPANLRNDMERELAAHKNTIADNSFQRRRSAMISKYHMVRFFVLPERKKAARLVKQLKRKLEQATDDEEKAKLQADLHIAEVDEAYTQHHPHAETYISLYGSAKKDADGDDDDEEKKTAAAKAALAAERPPMWKVVEATMEHGPDALRQLRERRSADGETEAAASKPRSRSIKPPPQRERMVNVIAKQNHAKNTGEPAGESKAASAGAAGQQNGAKPGLNRRERRRIMRETMAEAEKEDDEGGFFEM